MDGNRETWTAILLAGQRPGIDPLASHFGEQYKVLIPIGGTAMVDRVLASLLAAPAIGRIIVLAQEPDRLLDRAGVNRDRIVGVASREGIAASIASVLREESTLWPVCVTTADHPLLTPAIIEAFLGRAKEGDVSIGAVERATMLAHYPETRRTWLKFADGAYSGANLFALRNERTYRVLELWSRAEQDRKQAFKLFWHFGPVLAVRAMLRLIGFREAIARAGARLGVDAQLVVLDQPEAAIDVDKVSDHALVEQIIARREAGAAPGEPAARIGPADAPTTPA